MNLSGRLSFALVAGCLLAASVERGAHAQACCAGTTGLTPGLLANHERALVGVQARSSQTLGAYPASGAFYQAAPGRDSRIETTLFGSFRFLERAQAGLAAPFILTRRRAGATTETRTAVGDVTLSGRYDFTRSGESKVPGLAALFGVLAPTGTPPDHGTGLLAADVTGTGAWETSVGGSIEQTFGHFVAHATALLGLRASREVLGVSQHLGARLLLLAAGGYVFDNDVAMLVTVSHQSEGDATVGGDKIPDTGDRTTQAALLFVVPLGDKLRLRTSVFTDVPPLGQNRPALAGTSISLLRSWM